VGVQNRNLIKGALPRFRFPTGSQCSIYNLPVLNLLKPGEPLYIAEGCSDCWSLLSAGHKAIAIPSATLLSKKDADLLSTLNSQLSTEFHMYPDCDEPGERLFLQLQQVLPSLVHHQLPPGCKDFSEYYRSTRK
jgi:DNA primase